MKNFIIRNETQKDYRETEELVRNAFWNVYRPGCLEHWLIKCLRDEPDFVPELDLVMESEGRIIGQTVFVRACIEADDGRQIPIMTMGPICISPELQRSGLGKKLLDHALEKAAEMGCGAVCFEGNIGFYGKSGFRPGADYSLRYKGLPEGEDASFFLCKELIPGYLEGISGVYGPPSCYFVDEAEAERFDSSFPPREKLRLPHQIF